MHHDFPNATKGHPRPPKLDLERATSNSTSPRKDRTEHSLDRLHPHSTDKNLATSSKPRTLTTDSNFVKLFWNTWTTPRSTPKLQLATRLPKIGPGRPNRNRHPQVRTDKITRWIKSILTHPIKTWQSHHKLELRDEFGIPVKIILEYLDHTTKHPKATIGHSTPQNWSWNVRIEIDIHKSEQT